MIFNAVTAPRSSLDSHCFSWLLFLLSVSLVLKQKVVFDEGSPFMLSGMIYVLLIVDIVFKYQIVKTRILEY